MRRPFLLCLALGACTVQPDPGIDGTHITGLVQIAANPISERLLSNDTIATAHDLGALNFAVDVIDGTTTGWATPTDGGEANPDDDWFAFTSENAYAGTLYAFVGDGAADAGPPTLPLTDTDTDTDVVDTDTDVVDPDTDVPDTDTDEGGVVDSGSVDSADTAAGADGPLIHVSIVDLTDSKRPVVLFEADVSEAIELPFELAPDVSYGLHVEGLVGEGVVPWRIALPGLHPNDAGIKVGAFQSDDPIALGPPVAGTTPIDFVTQADWSYESGYDMIYAKSLGETDEPDNADSDSEPQTVVLVDEDLAEAWVFAADWSSLNAGLRAGTRYTSVPAHVDLRGDLGVNVDALLIDGVAVAVEGMSLSEEEPNDADIDAWDVSGAQPLGALSPIGYIDHVAGAITWSGPDAGTGVHDVDAYTFQVTEPVVLFSQLSWGDASDLDLYVGVADPEADLVDSAATYDNPELGGGALLEPGVDYYLIAVGYAAEDPTADTSYTLDLEWGAP